MSDEQINTAIAEVCGCTDIGECNCCFRLRGYPPEYSAHKKHTPNYCTDLNAIHEAEKELSKAQWEDFMQNFAETFLRTLGNWPATDKESLTVEATTEQSSAVHIGDTTEMEVQK